jgi:ABC-type phosphate/phosphonate transport system substrate-binding protein
MAQYTFMVCPHDTSQNPDKWLYFAQYLSLYSPIRVHMEMCFDFQEFHENFLQADLVYANPNDAIHFVNHTHGSPLVHPIGIYDEVAIVSAADNPATLADLAGAEVVSVQKMMVTGMGLRALSKQNIQIASIRNVDSWLAVVSELREGHSRYGFIYKDTYNMLSPHNKEGLHLISTTQERLLFHSLVVSPNLSESVKGLQNTILEMDQSAEGQAILNDLGFAKWLPVTSIEWQVQQEAYGLAMK